MIEGVPWPALFPLRPLMSAFACSASTCPRRRGRFLRSGGLALLLAGLLSPGHASAIEMFTFFGDGSRVPLPSLETPIEAYPGIPLRSDRLRAKRRAQRASFTTAPHGGVPGGITIRAMPPLAAPDPDVTLEPAPAAEPVPAPSANRPARRRWRR